MIPYIDPQHFKKQTDDDKKYKANKKSDVYSVGVLLWEISSGKKPFESYDDFPAALVVKVINGTRETPIPDTPIDYINIYISMKSVSLLFPIATVYYNKY